MDDPDFSADITPFEYPTNGAGDMRIAALSVRNGDGNAVTDVRYVSHKITPGKPALEGLPATFADDSQAETLEVEAVDPVTGVKVFLLYTVFADYGRDHPQRAGGKRRQRACHPGAGLQRLPGPAHHGLGHGPRLRPVGQREHHRAPPLQHGIQGIQSKRGMTGPNHNPLCGPVPAHRHRGAGGGHGP